jgi:membrane-bound lytic murein transglycosylase MltF
VQAGATLREGAELCFMVRKDNPQLKAELNSFVALYPEGSSRRNQLLNKYWKSTKFVKDATSEDEINKFERTVQFFRTYSGRYEMDYLLMMAQGYQESRLDQDAKSPVGAVGVMQVMPATGGDMKVGDIKQIEPNIHAGVKYMRFMMENFYKNEPMTPLNKGLFTFAAYNAGPGRVSGLRRETAKRGLDPNVWFNNVERVAAEKIGRETVTYVANIYKYYLAYKMIEEERVQLEEAKKKAASGG